LSESRVKLSPRRKWLISLFLILAAVVALASVLSPQLLSLTSDSVQIGQVSSQDILASNNISYSSQVLTEQKRAEAQAAVRDIYTLPDTSVVRQQVERLRSALAYITSVRSDTYANSTQKLEDLAAMNDVQLSREAAEIILSLNESRWTVVEQEAISVLDQRMRRPIREGDLESERNTIPAMISLALSQNQATVVVELVKTFLAPNSFFSPEMTDSARATASASVQPVIRSFMQGQTVLRRGEVLDDVDVEALEQLGLATPRQRWQDYAGALALVVVMACFLLLYLQRSPSLISQPRNLFISTLLFLGFLIAGRLTINGHVVLPYAFPVAAYGLLTAAFFGGRVSMISTLPLAVMIAYGMPNALDLTLYYMLGSLFGILSLGRARRISSFIYAGLVVSFSGWLLILAFRLAEPGTDWIGIFTLSAASVINGMASAAIALLLQHFLALFLGTSTPMQLMELTRPDHPLLKFILQQAPGTYQHSLQVSNLAEQAAERISADPLLTRVGALYHDSGKAANPIFFIENQLPGFTNPHEELDPEASAEIIIRHVADGVKLVRMYRLPRRIADFITEHHGTTLTRYQYVMAVAAAAGRDDLVDKSKFRYPGPKPQSRETAVLMLADACEARVRADRPRDEDELRALIKTAISQRVGEGELDEAELTLRDLEWIVNSFTATLRGLYHPRVQYPQLETSRSGAALVLTPLAVPMVRSSDDTVPVGQVSGSTSNEEGS